MGDLDLLPLLSLLPVRGYNPDFVTPPPRSPLESFEDEVARVRGTPPAQILKELEIFERQHGGFPAAAEPLRRHPRRELPKLARTLAAYWTRAVEPFWPRILALLSADLRYRATRLTEGGPAALFANLNPQVTFERDWVHVDHAWEGTVELAGQGLLLLPSAFSWQHVFTIALEPWQPSLVYPARGVALLWAPERAAAPELAGLMGATRARILSAVDAPASTTELAERLGLTAGGVSQHLSALAGARLVARTREGRIVLYARTPLGDSLVAGA